MAIRRAVVRAPISEAYADLMLAPLVVAARLPILWQEALTFDPKARPETRRMVAEKLAAAQEGIVAAQVAFGQAMFEGWAAMAFGQPAPSTPRRIAHSMVAASLSPAARKVKANVRRLGKH
jgi:hypothetical protein